MKRIFLGLIILMFLGSGFAYATGPYTDSAHGNSGYGVDRKDPFPAYAIGNCAHCHEQHASIGGTEPAPVGGAPDKYLLFSTNHTSQTVNFCFDCHVDASSQQTGGFINNYSYTYRAGNYDDGINDIKQAFDTANTSYHQLDDIVTFITDKWGYTADSNPCVACHNPHTVQGDPDSNASTDVKSSTTRGYPVSRPTEHANLSTTGTWNIWGDQQTSEAETMDDYTNYYQAPYRNGGVANGYEPDGSTTTDGSNLTDYVTFCQDCHASDMTASPYSLPKTPIEWATTDADPDKHGGAVATVGVNLDAPYAAAWGSTNGLVLACTDCHEPHGSPDNVYLIREEVNGASLSAITAFATTNWKYLCARCHDCDTSLDLCDIHHNSPDNDDPYSWTSCGDCHSWKNKTKNPCDSGASAEQLVCTDCHFHGSSAASRRTF